ncbi:MAG: HlyD family efflux transporter periplasmic adaptor subunit [Flavobacterium sp.]|uniref:HlyD family secretion protein n=1 Tax=Flavobacterium sp. TaxID=239 RepID=UPI0022C273FB|nr:HlyD family efflux transporter periplasmic adaptor subunit [Flavobacterium sp.]MCZ8330170.1 HlyD family efflux transporter periplasmic adaptor subunit [Flavobacterium sp.]
MEELQDDLKIYSEEVRDVLSEPPKAIFKWGNTLLLLFVGLLFFISWFIKYPDIIRAEVIITTEFPPEKLISKSGGKILKLLIKNQNIVKANTPIAVIENSADYKKVFLLKSITDTLKYRDIFYFPIEINNFSELGTIENAFSNFKNSYTIYRQYLDYKPHQIEKKSQSFESNQQQDRLSILSQQINIGSKELQLKKKELERFKILFDKGIISAQDWENRQFDYLQQERNQQNLKTQYSQSKSSLNDLNRNKQNTNVSELKDNVVLFQNTIQAFNQLKKEIADWDRNYVLRSSIKGKVSYFQIWSENQTVSIGEEIFSIIPTSSPNYIAKLKVPALNSGKIKYNQKVVIRLANYPDREFGILNGKLNTISLIPTREGILLLDAKLQNGLKTSYNKQILFKQEMTGTAEIITEDLRLIERFLYRFRDIFSI